MELDFERTFRWPSSTDSRKSVDSTPEQSVTPRSNNRISELLRSTTSSAPGSRHLRQTASRLSSIAPDHVNHICSVAENRLKEVWTVSK